MLTQEEQERALTRFAQKLDIVLYNYNLQASITDGEVQPDHVTFRAPLRFPALERDLAKVLGVRRCHLSLDITVTKHDGYDVPPLRPIP